MKCDSCFNDINNGEEYFEADDGNICKKCVDAMMKLEEQITLFGFWRKNDE